MTRKKKFFGKRALLNLPGHEGTAAIVAEVEDSSTWPAGKNKYGVPITNNYQAENDASLKISDCSRVVELTLDLSSDLEFNNSLHKIDTMIDALSALRTGVVIERDRYVERINNLPKGNDD